MIRAHGVLAGILDVAVRDRRLTDNPARGIRLHRKTSARRPYLSDEQVELLAGRARHPVLVYTLAYTGLRWVRRSLSACGTWTATVVDYTSKRMPSP